MRAIFMTFALLCALVAAFAQEDGGSDKEKTEPCDGKKSALTGTLIGTAGSVITAQAANMAGFTVAGIAKGSIAAAFQAKVGTVLGFSALQSLGATGALAVTGPVALGVGGAAALAYYMW